MLPFTVSWVSAEPAITDAGLTDVTVGVGGLVPPLPPLLLEVEDPPPPQPKTKKDAQRHRTPRTRLRGDMEREYSPEKTVLL